MRDNMKRILILGGGTAGSIVANKLARELRVEIAKDQALTTKLQSRGRADFISLILRPS